MSRSSLCLLRNEMKVLLEDGPDSAEHSNVALQLLPLIVQVLFIVEVSVLESLFVSLDLPLIAGCQLVLCLHFSC